MEQAEESSERAACSREQTAASEQAESAAVPMECSEPTGQTEVLPCLPDQMEGTYEQVVLSSGSEERSPEPAICEKPTQDEEFSEPWLNRFVEQLGRVPSLWRPGMHTSGGVIKEKTARGFGYMRLLAELEPDAEGDNKTRIVRAQALCKRFFVTLKKELRKAAVVALEVNPLASPDEALRSCPIWVRRADSFLNQMPLMVAQLNAQRMDKGKKKRPPSVGGAGVAPPQLQVPVAAGAAGAAFVRRVVRGVRRAVRRRGAATRAAIKEVAERLGVTEGRINQTWWGLRKLALYKLRQSIARGDAPSDNGRLNAVDWAIVDIVLLYREEMVNENLYTNYEQLSALLGTFHLVQRFELERNAQGVPLQEWVNAARWYSRNARSYSKNRVQMSAVALQKRWFELKQDTRRRFHAQMNGKTGLAPLPLHQAIARRYGYVVTGSAPPLWRLLVTSGQVAPPTSERGPAPGEEPVPRNVGDDDSSDSDTARAEDDDDVAIVEKSLETIDLSEDITEEDKTKEVVTTKEKAAVSCKTERLGHETGEKDVIIIVDNVTANTSDKPIVRLQKRKSSKHGNKPDKNHPESKKSKKTSKQIDKTIDKNKEIVDVDAPSPITDVIEFLQELDVNNFETTIVFDSDDEDVRPNFDKKSEVPNATTEGSVPSTNDSESQKNKAEKRHQRESSDSSNGNLVIDDHANSENDSSDSDAEDSTLRHRSKSANVNTPSENTQEAKVSKNAEDASKHPLLSGMLSSECFYDVNEDNAEENIKYNIYDKKRFHEYYPNSNKKKTRTVKSDEMTAETNDVEENEESSSDDGSRSSDSSGGKERELEEEEGSIDPKLLMYAVVLLERIDGCLAQPTSEASSKSSSPSPTRDSSSPESLLIKAERNLSPSWSPIRDTSSPIPPARASTPLLSRITPSPPLSPSSLFTRTSSPPLSLFKPKPHPDSLFHYFATTLPPKFVFNKNNIPLLRMCKFCSVVLQRIDLTEKGKMGNRVAKKVELPDIEEVRRNNRSMLTAQVAPRRARRTFGSTASPSSGSDSDWTPDVGDNSGVRRTQRRTAESGSDSRTQRRNSDESSSDSRAIQRRYTDESSSDSRATQRRDTDESDSNEGLRRVSLRRTADGSEFGVWRARQRAKEAELQRVLDNLAGIDGEKDCDHIKSTSMRGPAAAVLSSNCARCAARVLSAPPISGREARLQRQLLRRAARMARTTTPNTPMAFPPATTSTATATAAAAAVPTNTGSASATTAAVTAAATTAAVTTAATTAAVTTAATTAAVTTAATTAAVTTAATTAAVTTAATTAAVTTAATTAAVTTAATTAAVTTAATTAAVTAATPTIVMTKAPEIIHKDKPKKSKKRSHSPFHPPRPRTPPSPVDAEDAAREWLRQKNIAAEKFGIKPRSYKKIAPVVQDSAPATIQPITEANSATVPPQKSNEITIVLTDAMGGATVMPLTEENLAKHSGQGFRAATSGQGFRAATSSTTPTLFNPSAVADINKKLGALAPAKSLEFAPALKPGNTDKLQTTKANVECRPVITTTRINDDFRPVITNVQSLANLQKTPVKIVPARDMPDLNTPNLFAVVNKKDPNASKNIIIIPSTRNQPKKQEEVNSKENTEQLPQLVNVTGGIHLPSSSVGQELHLVVSQSPQKNTILNYQTSVSQKNTILNFQPNIVVSGSVIQGVETRPLSANTSRPYLVTSMAQRPPLILNSVLAGHSGQSPPLILNSALAGHSGQSPQQQFTLLNSPQVCAATVPREATAVAASQPAPLFTSMPSHSMHSTPMLVRSVQAGPTGIPSVTRPPWARTQPPNPPPAQPPNPPPVQPPNPPPVQPPNPPPAQPPNPPIAQHPNPPPAQPPNPPPAQHPNPPPASPASPASEEDTSDDGEIIMSYCLEFFRPPLASSAWCGGRDSTSLVVLCTGADEKSVWYIGPRLQQYILLSEEEKPPAEAEYWALRPRVRLALPGTDRDREGDPAAKPPKMPDPPDSNPAPEAAAPAVKPSYLKVKAFARMAPEPEEARAAPSPSPSPSPAAPSPAAAPAPADKLLAPARVYLNNMIYQKLSDDPLVYAKVLVAVADAAACRALLARAAPLHVYCLTTGKLYPLHAEPKKDVSRITLTGDVEISEALIALAKRLYKPSDKGEETEQESGTDREQDSEHIIEVRDAAEHMIDVFETNQQAGQDIQQPSNPSSQLDETSKDDPSATIFQAPQSVFLNILSNKFIQIQPSPGSTVTTVTTVTSVAPSPCPPLTKPGEVIELSDED